MRHRELEPTGKGEEREDRRVEVELSGWHTKRPRGVGPRDSNNAPPRKAKTNLLDDRVDQAINIGSEQCVLKLASQVGGRRQERREAAAVRIYTKIERMSVSANVRVFRLVPFACVREAALAGRDRQAGATQPRQCIQSAYMCMCSQQNPPGIGASLTDSMVRTRVAGHRHHRRHNMGSQLSAVVAVRGGVQRNGHQVSDHPQLPDGRRRGRIEVWLFSDGPAGALDTEVIPAHVLELYFGKFMTPKKH